MRRRPPLRSRAGLSLIEVVIGSTIFAGLGYVLAMSMRVSSTSHSSVTSNADASAELRESAELLRGELKAALASSIEVSMDEAGFSSLELQTAVRSDGAGPAWGAYDRSLALDEDDCHREDWRIRYEVDPQAMEGPTLERLVLDEDGEERLRQTLATGVDAFRVTESGEVWVVELQTKTEDGQQHDEEFDVRTRDA